jgi:hypothetical protein
MVEAPPALPRPIRTRGDDWLDTAGHQRGTVGVRWVGKDVVDVVPTTEVVTAGA